MFLIKRVILFNILYGIVLINSSYAEKLMDGNVKTYQHMYNTTLEKLKQGSKIYKIDLSKYNIIIGRSLYDMHDYAMTSKTWLDDDIMYTIIYNVILANGLSNTENNDSVAHEVAHLFAMIIYNNDEHDFIWSAMCIQLGGTKCTKYINYN